MIRVGVDDVVGGCSGHSSNVERSVVVGVGGLVSRGVGN